MIQVNIVFDVNGTEVSDTARFDEKDFVNFDVGLHETIKWCIHDIQIERGIKPTVKKMECFRVVETLERMNV